MCRKPVDMLKLTAVSLLSIGLALSIFSSFQTVASSDVASVGTFLIVGPDGKHFQGFFSSIQEAINQAENGSCVYISPNIYYEHVVVNKTISLIGEDVSTTIIDGYPHGTIVTITADNVTIADFTIQNSGWGWYRNGIYVYRADNCKIEGNILLSNCQNIRLNCSRDSQVLGNVVDGDGYGIRLISSSNCTAAYNKISNCIGGVHLQNATSCTVTRNCFTQNSQGVRMYSPCTHNKIIENTVSDNTYDGMIEEMPPNGTFFNNNIFHNSFINNTNPFIYKRALGNIWDDGYPSGGNYWSRYNGTDLFSGSYQNETGSDGIGDKAYVIGHLEDRYPLMKPYVSVHNIDSNSTYSTIQSAIDASETLDGHTFWINSGTYFENVHIHKSLTLIGANQANTIIDGNNAGTVLTVNADNVSIVELTIRNSGSLAPPYGNDCGVLLDHSDRCSISHCLASNNRMGIYLFFSEACVIEHNSVFSNKQGIWLWYSGDNVLKNNEISNNLYNFGVFGGDFLSFNNSVDISNTVDGRQIRYLLNVEDEIFDSQTSIGVLYLINCNNVTVRNLNLSKNGHGVFCYNATDSVIENVTVLGNNYGIYLQNSWGNVVSNNSCFENWVGICLQDSDHNVVEENTAGDSEKGISLYEADYNSLRGNNILSNLYGVRLYSSHLNDFFHNNLVENTNQVDLITSHSNAWDNGCEGNYWSNYNGTDLDGDGIGDTNLPWEGVDYYPLMNLYWNPADVNHDLKVNIFDVVRICVAYGTAPSDTGWNPHCDIAEPYGIIDIDDVLEACVNYGKRYSNS